jgi:uncharacterized protein (TIGR02271 family)
MTTMNYAPELLEHGSVVDSQGDSIGKVGQVYLDNRSGQPSWVTVKTGWFGASESFVPLGAASIQGDTIQVPYTKDMIKGAPHNEIGVPLTETDEQGLYSYYGMGDGQDHEDRLAPVEDTGAAAATGDVDGYLTRSEEQLHVGTEKRETGRARLRKYVVTEDQSVTVPVRHEEVRMVREPMGPGDSLEDATIGEEATDVMLTEERVVINKETVPVEKVHLDTETVTEQQEVTEAVRKEQIEFDDGATGTAYADQIDDVDEHARQAD